MEILNEEIFNYLNGFVSDESGILGEIQQSAARNHVPIIKKEAAVFLKTILSIKKPFSILEIGTAVGFSASLMSAYLRQDGFIYTIERNEKRFLEATKNIEKQGLKNITIFKGDALEVIKTLDKTFDVIFLDAAKSQYINMLNDCLKLLNDDGIIIADNVLQNGTVALDIKEIERRHRTIHRRMNTFISVMAENADFNSTVVPIGDGILLSVKKSKIKNVKK